jgi:hypothetical protein
MTETTATNTLAASSAPAGSVTSWAHGEPGPSVTDRHAELRLARQRVADAWSAFEAASSTAEVAESQLKTATDLEILEMEVANGDNR